MSGAAGSRELLLRAYRASGILFLTALLLSLGFRSWRVSLGVTAGFGVAMLILLSWQLIVKWAFEPRENSPAGAGENSPAAADGARAPGSRRGLAIGLGLAKLPVLGAIVWVLVGRGLVSPEAFAAGFLVPQLAIGLLALGRMSAKNKEETRAAPRRG